VAAVVVTVEIAVAVVAATAAIIVAAAIVVAVVVAVTVADPVVGLTVEVPVVGAAVAVAAVPLSRLAVLFSRPVVPWPELAVILFQLIRHYLVVERDLSLRSTFKPSASSADNTGTLGSWSNLEAIMSR
jgi:hypothetical protein